MGRLAVINKLASAYQPLDLRVLLEEISNRPQGAGAEVIVGIDPADNVTGRRLQPLVDGVTLTFIAAADPACEPVFIFPNQVHGPISAAPIKNTVFQSWIPLIQHRLNRVLQELDLVKGRGNNGYAGLFHIISGGVDGDMLFAWTVAALVGAIQVRCCYIGPALP
jgi:hypothetical protein